MMYYEKAQQSSGIKTLGEIIRDMLRRNTELCVDLKTLLTSDSIARQGKHYLGQLVRDAADHFTFRELPPTAGPKRNPRVFEGRHITITRWDDGSLHPNFRPTSIANLASPEYPTFVALELRAALKSLLEKHYEEPSSSLATPTRL